MVVSFIFRSFYKKQNYNGKNIKKETDKKTESTEKKPFGSFQDSKNAFWKFASPFFNSTFGFFHFFFIYGQQDQSTLTELASREETSGNWLGKFGAVLADFFIYKGFGAASFLFVKLIFLTGAFLALEISFKKLKIFGFGICL